jgi:uncharacterized membrane protein YiaA
VYRLPGLGLVVGAIFYGIGDFSGKTDVQNLGFWLIVIGIAIFLIGLAVKIVRALFRFAEQQGDMTLSSYGRI